jgi:hypothetical protein
MQSDNDIYQAINTIYSRITAADAAARASLLTATLLLDIRAQNQRIIQLLEQKR